MSGLTGAKEALRAERARIDTALAELDRLDGPPVLKVAEPAPQPAAPAPEPTPAPPVAPTPPPPEERVVIARGRQGRPWEDLPGYKAWRKQLLATVFAQPKRSPARVNAMRAIAAEPQKLPDGTFVMIGMSTLYEWTSEGSKEGEGAAAVTTPAAAKTTASTYQRAFQEAMNRPSRDIARPDSKVWRRGLLSDVLALPDSNARKDALRDIAKHVFVLADGTRMTFSETVLSEWFEEAMSNSPALERERLQTSGEIGNPAQLAKGFDRPDRRRLDCPVYSKCLGFVVRRGWSGWTCDGCTGPGKQQSINVGGKSGVRLKKPTSLRIVETPTEEDS